MKLDAFLRDRVFQKIAEAAGARADVTCYGLAAQAALAALVFGELSIVSTPELGGVVFYALMWLAVCALCCVEARRLERALRARPDIVPAEALVHIVGASRLVFRLFWLAAVSLDATELALEIGEGRPSLHALVAPGMSAGFLCHVYFLACRPRLPRARRAKAPPAGAFAGAPP